MKSIKNCYYICRSHDHSSWRPFRISRGYTGKTGAQTQTVGLGSALNELRLNLTLDIHIHKYIYVYKYI